MMMERKKKHIERSKQTQTKISISTTAKATDQALVLFQL